MAKGLSFGVLDHYVPEFDNGLGLGRIGELNSGCQRLVVGPGGFVVCSGCAFTRRADIAAGTSPVTSGDCEPNVSLPPTRRAPLCPVTYGSTFSAQRLLSTVSLRYRSVSPIQLPLLFICSLNFFDEGRQRLVAAPGSRHTSAPGSVCGLNGGGEWRREEERRRRGGGRRRGVAGLL